MSFNRANGSVGSSLPCVACDSFHKGLGSIRSLGVLQDVSTFLESSSGFGYFESFFW